MGTNQLTLKEQGEIFGGLCEKSLTLEERGVGGAKIFKRRVGGILGIRRRTEAEMEKLLTEMDMVNDSTGAKELINSLRGYAVVYGGIVRDRDGGFYEKPSLARYFTLEKREKDGDVSYKVSRWDTLSDGSW